MKEDPAAKDVERIDRQILDLLSQRLAARRKSEDTAAADVVQRDAELKRLLADAKMEVPEAVLRPLMLHIDSVCQSQISQQRIAFLGPQHSYSHLAAIKYFGEAADFAPAANIAAVFDCVVRHEATMGIVPVENSTDGRVVDTLGMFVRTPVKICGEVLLPIHHNLLSITPAEEITDIYSKPQAISQCREWLAKHMPNVTLNEMSSTAAAAKLASEKRGVAAIASDAAGRQYGLNTLAASIEDNPNNVTRFAVLGEGGSAATGNDKTALLFKVNHQPGALADVMNVIKGNALNLTWIESFPMPQTPNEYLFFVELEGHTDDRKVAQTLEQLSGYTQRCDVLGSYPRDLSSRPQ